MSLALDLTFVPPVISHRGARFVAPENTMAAFEAAHDEGANWLETDVKLSSDGVPILFHDDTLDRTTSGTGPVSEMLWSELKKLDAGSFMDPKFAGARIPLMTELLQFVISHYLRVNLELKPCPGRSQATTMVTLIEAAKIWPDDHPPPLISSFDIESLEIAARLQPDWPRGLILSSWQDNWQELVARTNANLLTLEETLLTKDRVDLLLVSELPVLAYTVNEPRRAAELINWGLSAVFSDTSGDIIKHLRNAS